MEFKEGILYEIYFTDRETDDTFAVGYFVSKDDEYVVFQCVSRDGHDGGMLLVKMENIWTLQYNTTYCQSLEKLIKHFETKFEKISFKSKNLKKEFLMLAQKNRGIVGVELNDSDSVDLLGFVINISEDFVETLEVSDVGCADGNGCCRFDEITKVYVNASRDKKYKILFEINEKMQSL